MRMGEKFGLPVVSLIDTPGRVSGHRGGGTACRGSHRGEPARDDGPAHPESGGGHRRRGVGRRVGDRRDRPRADAWKTRGTRSSAPKGPPPSSGKTPAQRQAATEALKVGARELLKFGLIDEVVAEPGGRRPIRSRRSPSCQPRCRRLNHHLRELCAVPLKQLLPARALPEISPAFGSCSSTHRSVRGRADPSGAAPLFEIPISSIVAPYWRCGPCLSSRCRNPAGCACRGRRKYSLLATGLWATVPSSDTSAAAWGPILGS